MRALASVDQRAIDAAQMLEVSIGLHSVRRRNGGTDGTDAVVRLLPGVIGKEKATARKVETGLLEPSLYTHPRNWNGIEAPEILASGHHQKIAEWRLEEAKKEADASTGLAEVPARAGTGQQGEGIGR